MDREASQVIFGSVVVMREMVPVEALGGYRAFHLAVIRSQEERRARILGEGQYFGSADGQTTYEEALSNLGVLYDLGLGVEPDQARAVRLYRRAAEQGFVPAWNNLGVAYALGRARLCAGAENPGRHVSRRMLDPRNDEAGVEWMMAAASKEGFFEAVSAAQRNVKLKFCKLACIS